MALPRSAPILHDAGVSGGRKMVGPELTVHGRDSFILSVLMHRRLADMLYIMRTAISHFDRLVNQVRRAVAVIFRTLSDALRRREPSEPPPFRLLTVRSVSSRPGVDLDRPRALEAEDEDTRFKNTQR